MKIKNKFQYIATPAKVFMTVLIVLIAVLILQNICIEIERIYARKKYFTAEEKPEAELSQEDKRKDKIRYSAKEFLPDGTIHLINKLTRTSNRKGQEQIYDTNDNLLWEGPSDNRPYEYFSWAEQLRSYGGAFTPKNLKQIQVITPGFSRYIEIPVSSDGKIAQIWRYYPGAHYFKGYDIRGRKIGYIGSNGFTESTYKVKPFGEFGLFAAWFPPDASNLELLWQTQRHIYQIDFEKQEVETIFESTDADIRKVNLHAWRSLAPEAKEYIDRKKYRPLIHCETKDDKHHLILREPKQQLSFNLRRPRVTATRQEIFVRNMDSNSPPTPDMNSSHQIINKWLREYREKSWNMWTELYKVNNQGNLELVTRYDYTRPPLSGPVTKARDPRPPVQRYVSQFSPPLYDFVLRLLGRKFWSSTFAYQNRGDFFNGLAQMILEIRPYGGFINRILSSLMMVFVFWHCWPRRTSWTKFIFWLVFTGLFNIAGLLTYLALNHTAVIKCPACGKHRGLGKVDCVRCQGPLPGPERGKLDLIFSA